ncbi:L-aspartate oxidase [Salegentibacter holothuriorum]|uniref:L-aspartate oxidase n=1 Tax=Salegentibacter holothuriorum TaxID=241145 RepID=A0A1T5AGU9_9FLAO|nr:L-aspartate oxidase [Salegentibacter holothuriorum]SKB34166.1 L-aspartate oxidase [Salegentibacter holothuriorum]
MIVTDYLVIGSGIAGLTFAVKIASKLKDKTICIVTKADEDESNTKYAQGGVAVVLDFKEDSFQKHITDTLIAGDGLCDDAVVKMVVEEGPKRFKDLQNWGASFDQNKTGVLNLGKEGGHSENRIVHHKDITGYEIETLLLKRVHELKNVMVLNHHFAVDLITEHHLKTDKHEDISCYGAYVLNQETGTIETIKARSTLLATGGIGKVYGHTTNPNIATGDGIAMAFRAKAYISDMEFIQFHPTVLHDKNQGQSFLISEAVRGFGAYLRNKKGQRFMLDYDERGELASRDIVARCIDNELKNTGEPCVYLDCTHITSKKFKSHFPNIYNECASRNINIEKAWIPIVPASHYLCGGIEVDNNGKTSIGNLFACGECSRTGLHGANRLASNSLLESLVYAHNVYHYMSTHPTALTSKNIPDWDDKGTIEINSFFIHQKTEELQYIMREYVGIVRSNERLLKASEQLAILYQEIEALYKTSKLNTTLCELRNMVNVAYLIINQSIERKENRGGYFNIDMLEKIKVFENGIA